jgi:REP element-mobilizing transposase RayT
MTRPRKELICVNDTSHYHVVSPSVRCSFLCGVDHTSGKNYEHHRQWIANRLRLLASFYSINICAYAIMSDHFHITVKLFPEKAK